MFVEKKQIGQVLFEHGFISKDVLDKAIKQQSNFTAGIAQYLLEAKSISEENLAKFVSNQLGIPYIPLRAYAIPQDIIGIVPVRLVEKYWLVPLDKMEDVITVVILDPFNFQAVKEVEETTGYKVQTFVGMASDILKAIEHYYGVSIKYGGKKASVPLSVKINAYTGPERRRSVRLDVKIDMHFPMQDLYKKSEIKNVSRHGLLFESKNILPLDSFVILQINLPTKFSKFPIAAVVHIARVAPLDKKRFDIGAELIKISPDDLQTIIEYAQARKGQPDTA